MPAALLASLTAAAVGYAMASVLPAQVAMLFMQALVFIALLFSPVSYPAERVPVWLQHVHDWSPIEPMAQLVRSGLANDVFDVRALVGVLLAWAAVAGAGASAALASECDEVKSGSVARARRRTARAAAPAPRGRPGPEAAGPRPPPGTGARARRPRVLVRPRGAGGHA